MQVHKTIKKFLNQKGYKQDHNVLGVLFYGSCQHRLNNSNSDIDLLIVYKNEHSRERTNKKGNAIVDGKRIEYFKKTVKSIQDEAEEGYLSRDNSTESTVVNAEIIFQRDETVQVLQRDVKERFKNGVLPLTEDEAKEQVSIIDNRMKKLRKYAGDPDDFFFEHLYHLTIDKIRKFYHDLNGIPKIETSKAFKLYKDEAYQNMFAIYNIPDPKFLEMYFRLLQTQGKSKEEMLADIEEFYAYSKRTVCFESEHDYRIPIKSRYRDYDIKVNTDLDLKGIEIEQPKIPERTLKIVNTFIDEMGYRNDEHCLGVIVYGSSLTGFDTEQSDIDLHIIFDNSDPNRMVRGAKVVNGRVVEYFEKPIYDEYLMTEYEYHNRYSAALAILGKGSVVYAKDESLENLQKYALHRFKDHLPYLSIDESKDQIAVLDNRMRKLENLLNDNSPYFNHYSHLVLEQMRKAHHRIIGIPKIPTSKAHIVYTNEEYRKATCKENPSQDFVDEYLRLTRLKGDKHQILNALKDFYIKVKNGIVLENEFEVQVERRGVKPTFSAAILARLALKRMVTNTDVNNNRRLFETLRTVKPEIEL